MSGCDRQKIGQRALQREKRKQQILNCCLDAIVTKGYESMKIRDIADMLGISTGLFFNYFESKEAVFEELVRTALKGPQGMAQLIGVIEDPVALFYSIARYILDALASSSETAKYFLLMQQTMNREALPESIRILLNDFDSCTPFLPVIERGQQMGQIREGNPLALIVMFWSSLQGIAQMHAHDPALPLPSAEWVVDALRGRDTVQK
ncbi:MAG: TetR/AcrR family transcriptional regulator [Anaerofustis sp.]